MSLSKCSEWLKKNKGSTAQYPVRLASPRLSQVTQNQHQVSRLRLFRLIFVSYLLVSHAHLILLNLKCSYLNFFFWGLEEPDIFHPSFCHRFNHNTNFFGPHNRLKNYKTLFEFQFIWGKIGKSKYY